MNYSHSSNLQLPMIILTWICWLSGLQFSFKHFLTYLIFCHLICQCDSLFQLFHFRELLNASRTFGLCLFWIRSLSLSFLWWIIQQYWPTGQFLRPYFRLYHAQRGSRYSLGYSNSGYCWNYLISVRINCLIIKCYYISSGRMAEFQNWNWIRTFSIYL